MNQELIILETDRLILRRLQAEDSVALTDLWTNPVVTKHMGGPRDRDQLTRIFTEDAQTPFAEQFDLWPVVEKGTYTVVGHCGLLDKEIEGELEIEINYIICPDAWGKGYATEIGRAILNYALEDLNIPRVVAIIAPENKTSEWVARKLGMVFEKDVIRPDGSLKKVYVYPLRNS